jgi:hypothetical protein
VFSALDLLGTSSGVILDGMAGMNVCHESGCFNGQAYAPHVLPPYHLGQQLEKLAAGSKGLTARFDVDFVELRTASSGVTCAIANRVAWGRSTMAAFLTDSSGIRVERWSRFCFHTLSR